MAMQTIEELFEHELGMKDAVELLEQTLQEEEAALNRLKMIASEFDVAEEAEEAEPG